MAASERLRLVLDERLVGLYAVGSYALGDYVPGRSDLDVAAVVRSPLSPELGEGVAGAMRHEALPCPARSLELVIYRLDTARSGSATSDFELNLNTGQGMPLSVQSKGDSGDVGSHWFAIDRSILSQAGIALLGPPADDVFARIAVGDLIPVLVESVRWHRDHASDPSDAVLNACRALRYADDERWSSKPAAGRWAAEHGLAPPNLVARALTARTERSALDATEAEGFLRATEARLRASVHLASP
jgi:hypothetical protein